jgi:hypothetical protein
MPCSLWYEEYTIDNGDDRDKVKGDGGGNGCTDEAQANGFGAPY